jgi:hypothetical protein
MIRHVMQTDLTAVVTLLVCSAALHAAQLKQETLQAWNQYIEKAESQMSARLQPQARFLSSAESAETMRRVHAGEIIVAPAAHNPRRIADGLIHDWEGAAFIPGSNIADVFAVIRDYARYKQYYAPLVIDSRPLGRVGAGYTFAMLMMNQSLFAKSALDGEYSESYFRVSDSRWYSVAYSTRIQQVDDFGRENEHRLPADQGSGYIWRLYTISRFEQRDGGVYVEMEVIALSRDIPISLRWIVDPIVRRVSRGSLLTSLEKTRTAVSTEIASASRGADRSVVAQNAAGGR